MARRGGGVHRVAGQQRADQREQRRPGTRAMHRELLAGSRERQRKMALHDGWAPHWRVTARGRVTVVPLASVAWICSVAVEPTATETGLEVAAGTGPSPANTAVSEWVP